MAVLVKSGIPSPASVPLMETDRINAQLAAADGRVGDLCSLGAGGWSPCTTVDRNARMVIAGGGATFKAGESITPLNAGVRIRYAAVSGSGVTPGTLFYQDTTNPYALNSTPNSGVALANPTTAPVLTEGGTGALGAGDYTVGRTLINANGETLLSTTAVVTLGASKKLHVAAFALPTGATGIRYYVSRAAGDTDLGFSTLVTDGLAFDINALPAAGDAEPPTVNTTASVSGGDHPFARALANATGAFEGVIELL